VTIVEGIKGFFAIPAGTHPSVCRLCGRGPIYWITHTGKPSKKYPKGKTSKLPIAINDPRAMAPTPETFGQGYSHFADCPEKHRLAAEVSKESGREPPKEIDLMQALKDSLQQEGADGSAN
jgi:hypothetical protein